MPFTDARQAPMTSLAQPGTAAVDRFPTIPSIVDAARQALPPQLWDHSGGGVEFETTLRRNRLAFDRIGFRPRLLRDVRRRSTAASFLGRDLRLPVMLAPIGSIHHYGPEGAISSARAAERAGTIMFLSTEAPPGIRAIRDAGVEAPIVYQLYVFGGRDWIIDRVRLIEEAGCIGLCFTADAPVAGNRDRNQRNRFVSRTEDISFGYREHFTWDDFDWLRSITKLPLMVKGLTSPQDAKLAVEHGADVVYVSNHGGRQLDHQQGAIEVLPAMVDAVAGQAGVVFDSGILRGSDVIKAIALGASAVSIGKLQAWSLAAGGEDALERALALLREEMLSIMGLIGVNSLDELGPEHLCELSPAPNTGWIGFQPSSLASAPPATSGRLIGREESRS
jgi:isopentenyl diphosphate isomerase/L-lactate dehydrogenase-like FMN-dependent dehydrogenase